MSNILEPIPASLNDYLLKYNNITLSSTTPAAPGGNTNVTFQMDGFGNISAYSPTSGGGSVSITAGSAALTVAPSPITGTGTVDLNLSHANTWTATQTFGAVNTTTVTAGSGNALALVGVGGGYNVLTFTGGTSAGYIGLTGNQNTSTDSNLYIDVPTGGEFSFRVNQLTVASVTSGGNFASAVSTVATATTIAPVGEHVNLTGTTAIATITLPAGLSATVGARITFYPASTVATTTAGNIASVYSLIGGKAYDACYNGSKWFFIGSGI